MNYDDLTPKQREAVDTRLPVVLVLGGAGTGKTTTALWAARQHLLREGAGAQERVLFVTFSRTAVSQIARRSPSVLAEMGRRVEVQTFHSLAYRLLRAFGRYMGHVADPVLQTQARARIMGYDPGRITYDELLPQAIELVRAEPLHRLTQGRWTLIICDEFQDTSDDQWALLHNLGSARCLLLADPHQMIYDYQHSVGPQRLIDAKGAANLLVELEERSHRDPTGVIPAMAAAVRERDFGHEAVRHAVDVGRLQVVRAPGNEAPDAVRILIKQLHNAGLTHIGVFGTTNDGVATLAAELTDRKINHALVGIPEAHGEATLAMGMLVAVGLAAYEFNAVRIQLAIFAAASTRQRPPGLPELIPRPGALPEWQEERMRQLEASLRGATDTDELIEIATNAWDALGMGFGLAAWRRAAAGFAAFTRRALATDPADASVLVQEILEACERLRTEAAISADSTSGSSVQLMNLFQSKGREVDAVILLYREGGFVTSHTASEPFRSSSRPLYVALTRARTQAIVLLPPAPHDLIAPFAQFVAD